MATPQPQSGVQTLQGLFAGFVQLHMNMTGEFMERAVNGQYGINDFAQDWSQLTAEAVRRTYTAWGLWLDPPTSRIIVTGDVSGGATEVTDAAQVADPGQGAVVNADRMSPRGGGSHPHLDIDVALSSKRNTVLFRIDLTGAVAGVTYETLVYVEPNQSNKLFEIRLNVI